MDTYVFKVNKYIGIKANNIDDALYRFREGFSDGESEEEVSHIYKDNDFLVPDILDEEDE